MSNNINDVRRRLLTKYSPKQKGTWRILGEDPNCDMGGSHHEPHLSTVEGTYENVVEHALSLKGFFSWGDGGRIELIESTINVDKLFSAKIKKLQEERRNLEDRIKLIDEMIKREIEK